MRFFAAALFFFGAAVSNGQSPEVPHKMQFAGMTLTIRDDARREIQKDVDALTKHPYYFNMKVERAKTYFPLIEKIFEEERVPTDFKYLALQESALISDAVSVSNAVGFWQFKDFTAEEMGMRVDRDVDERMNLVSATRGAARYLKQNNFYFNNWVYALQAYQMGAGGAMRAVGERHNGAKHMDINSDTYWYVKKYLAHKIAFENAINGDAQLKVMPYEVESKTTLKDLAETLSADLDQLTEYNKWAKKGVIPDDKKYIVLVPVGTYDQNFTKLSIAATSQPEMVESNASIEGRETILINEVPAIKARAGDQLTALADRGGISLSAFLRYNDISITHVVVPGALYFVDKKKNKASEPYHKVEEGENLWLVSQTYGVKLKRLKKYNRIEEASQLTANSMLWLSSNKPDKEESIEAENGVVELDTDKTFNWGKESNPTSQMGEVIPNGQALNNDPDRKELVLIANDPDIKAVENLPMVTSQSVMHEVKPSDTLYSVARQYGVTIQDLMEWNQKKDFSLAIGEKLKIIQR